MRTLLICHDGAELDREGLARWLASFTDLCGTVVVCETPGRRTRRIRREVRRVGLLRFADVVAYRLYHRLIWAAADRAWQQAALKRLRTGYPGAPAAPECLVSSPNAPEAEAFLRERRPDLIVARCKTLLKEQVFSIPRLGTFVLHPGICPEYRNAHGCFWALARGDADNVGVTLLRIDRGIDTGPVFGYFRITAEPARESHVTIQDRALLDNLDRIRDKLLEIERGLAEPLDTAGRKSAAWGQPWLTAYASLRWVNRAPRSRAISPTLSDTHTRSVQTRANLIDR